MKKDPGAVSIFLIIVLFTTILFGGLFIDATRILLAERFVQNTVDSAARSALSYYDGNLSSEYGLFAVNATDAENAFRRYVKTNIKLSRNDQFDILKMEVDDKDIKVSVSKPLSDEGTLLTAMEEYSKYRSVVNTGYILVDKISGIFKNTSGKVFNAADSGKTALDQLAADATEFSNSARTLISTTLGTTKDRFKNSLSALLRGGETSVGDEQFGFGEMQGNITDAYNQNNQINGSIQTYEDKNKAAVDSLKNEAVESTTYYDSEENEMKKSTSQETNDGYDVTFAESQIPSASKLAEDEKNAAKSKIDETQSRLDQKKAEIRRKTAEATQKNEEIAQLRAELDVLEAEKERNGAEKKDKEEAQRNNPARYVQGDISEQYSSLWESINSPETSDKDKACAEKMFAYLEAYEAWVNASSKERITAKENLDAATTELERCYRDYGKKLSAAGDEEIDELKKKTSGLDSQIEDCKRRIKNVESERDELVKSIEKLYDEIPAAKTEAGKIELPNSVTGKDKSKTKDGIGSFFSKIKSTIESSKKETMKIASDVNGEASLEEITLGLDDMLDNVSATVDKFAGMANSLCTLVTDPEKVGDAFLFTDYVFDNHTFFTSQTKRANRHFQAGEIEYILQGYDSQAKCIMHTVSDIAELRLLINFIDYMCTTNSPEIISRTIIALGRAAIRTVKDMAGMIFTLDDKESASCGLCPSFDSVRLTYSDHLRLRMLLAAIGNENRSKMMDRVQTLMSDTLTVQNWGKLETYNTYLAGEVTVQVDLVMLTLPMFESMLPKDNQILQDGHFLVHKKVSMGY